MSLQGVAVRKSYRAIACLSMLFSVSVGSISQTVDSVTHSAENLLLKFGPTRDEHSVLVVIKKTDGKWTSEAQKTFYDVETDPDLEAVKVDLGSYMFSSPVRLTSSRGKDICDSWSERSVGNYDICSTHFSTSKDVAATVASNILVAAVTMGASLAFGGIRRTYEFDTKSFTAAVLEANVIPVARRKALETLELKLESAKSSSDAVGIIKNYDQWGLSNAEFYRRALEKKDRLTEEENRRNYTQRLQNYHSSFDRIASSEDALRFVQNWASFDPNGLIEKAEKLQKEYKAKEEAAVRAAEASRIAAQAAAEREYEGRKKRVENWRRALKVSSETSCGPVLEIRSNLVKVYSPVANYGNEHWINLTSLFPLGYGCRWFNGQYVAPDY